MATVENPERKVEGRGQGQVPDRLRPVPPKQRPKTVRFQLHHLEQLDLSTAGQKHWSPKLVAYGNTVESPLHPKGLSVAVQITDFYPSFLVNVDGWADGDIDNFVKLIQDVRGAYQRHEVVHMVEGMSYTANHKAKILRVYYSKPSDKYRIYHMNRKTGEVKGVLANGFLTSQGEKTVLVAENRQDYDPDAIFLMHYDVNWEQQLLYQLNRSETKEGTPIELHSVVEMSCVAAPRKLTKAQMELTIPWDRIQPTDDKSMEYLLASITIRAYTENAQDPVQPNPETDRLLSIAVDAFWWRTDVGPTKAEIDCVMETRKRNQAAAEAWDAEDEKRWQQGLPALPEPDTIYPQVENGSLSRPVKVFSHANEGVMLTEFAKYMATIDPDILITCDDWYPVMRYIKRRLSNPSLRTMALSRALHAVIPQDWGNQMHLPGRSWIDYAETLLQRNPQGLDPKLDQFTLRDGVNHHQLYRGIIPPMDESAYRLSLLPPQKAMEEAVADVTRDVLLLSSLEFQGMNLVKYVAISQKESVPLTNAAAKAQGIKALCSIFRKCTQRDVVVNIQELNERTLKVSKSKYNTFPEPYLPKRVSRQTKDGPGFGFTSDLPQDEEILPDVTPAVGTKRKSLFDVMIQSSKSRPVKKAKSEKRTPHGKHGKDIESYQGALVWEPVPGLYDVLATLDFASLYPTIMDDSEFDYSTRVSVRYKHLILDEEGNVRPEMLPHCKFVPINDTDWCDVFCTKDYTPILVELVREGCAQRKVAKGQKKAAKDPFVKGIYDGVQLAYKIRNNSLYGFTGIPWESGGKLTMVSIARAVCYVGQHMNKKITSDTLQLGHYVIAGDTDSIMVQFKDAIVGKDALETRILNKKAFDELADMLTKQFRKPHDLENECLMINAMFFANDTGGGIKKCYAATIYEDPAKKKGLKCQGMPQKKRDRCRFVRKLCGRALAHIQDNEPEKVDPLIRRKVDRLCEGAVKIEDLSVSVSIQSEYKNENLMIQREVAKRITERTKRRFGDGDRIFYSVVSKDHKGYTHDKVAYRGEDPAYMKQCGLTPDIGWVLEKQLEKPLTTLLQHHSFNVPKFIQGRLGRHRRKKLFSLFSQASHQT